MKKTIDTTAQTVTFTFEGLDPVTLAMSAVSPANATYAMLHGFAARIGDNAAIQKSEANNYTVTETMRRDAVLELVEHYASGSADWNVRQAGARTPKQDPRILAKAVAKGMTYEQYVDWMLEQF